jgi:hypothetical protein
MVAQAVQNSTPHSLEIKNVVCLALAFLVGFLAVFDVRSSRDFFFFADVTLDYSL